MPRRFRSRFRKRRRRRRRKPGKALRAVRRLRVQLRPELKYKNASDSTGGLSYNSRTTGALLVTFKPTFTQGDGRGERTGNTIKLIDMLMRITHFYSGADDNGHPSCNIRVIWGIWHNDGSLPTTALLSTNTGSGTFYSGYEPYYRDRWRKLSDRSMILGSQGQGRPYINRTHYIRLGSVNHFSSDTSTSISRGYPFVILICQNDTNIPWYEYGYRIRFTDV